MKKALLIVNPVSGKLKARSAIFRVIEKLNERDVIPTVVMTKYRGHAAALSRTAEQEGYDCVICCGGDGTLNETIEGLADAGSSLPIGYITAGTTNDFASGLGLPLDLPTAAADIADALNSGEYIETDIGRFNDKRIFNYIASFGAFSSSSYNAPQAAKNVLGHLAYVLQGGVDFFSIKPVHAIVNANGRRYENDYVFGGVCNTFSVGGIVKLSRDNVDISDGKFEIILVKNPRDIVEFNKIVNAVMTSNLNDSMFDCIKASNVPFEVPAGMSWSLDGEEVKGGNPVTVTNMKRAVRLLVKKQNE